jgi:putative transposase
MLRTLREEQMERVCIFGSYGVGTIRRELLDYVIPLNEYHLRRLGREYLAYYQEDRTHDGLGKQTPGNRLPQARPDPTCSIIGWPRLGGLHHRYEWSRAA